MRYIPFIFIVLFIHIPFCLANDTTYESLLKQIEALKKENQILERQLSDKSQATITKESPKSEETFIREPDIQKTVPTVTQTVSELSPSKVSFEEKLDEDIEEIVVTATRTKKSIKNVGSSITVIGNEQIENSKAQLVSDVLRQVPGLEVRRNGGIGGTTNIHIRGGTPNQTLVFIDGVQLNSPTDGSFNFADLTTDNIERVEILRGPQSTLYGSEAIGGVVNIITKKGAGPATATLSSEYGSHETYKETVNFSAGTEKFDYSGSISYLKTSGISFASSRSFTETTVLEETPIGDGEATIGPIITSTPNSREEDGYTNFTGSIRLGRNFLDDGRVDTTLRIMHAEFDLDAFIGGKAVDDENRRQEKDNIFWSAKAEKTLFDIWTPSILVSVNDTELETIDLTGESREVLIPTRLWRAEHQSDINVTDFDTVTLGFEYEVQEGENQGPVTTIDKQIIYNRAAFIQNQIKLFDSIDWTMGLRYDRHSSFGVHYTYRSTLSYTLENIRTRFHGSWGKGFRAPDLNELFFPNSGNPDLNPEESKGWDIGAEYEFIKNKLTIDVTYFQNDFTDLIVSTPQPDGTSMAENVGKAEAEGFESSLTYKPSNILSFIGTYTYSDTKDRDKNRPLSRIPRNRATLTMNVHPLEKLNINLTGLMVRDRINSDGSDMEDYWLADLSLRYDISELITANIRSENLFDRDYEEIDGWSSLDQTIYAGIDINF